MKKRWEVTKEEFEAIEEAITAVLSLWQYEMISASDESGRSTGMSKKTFFETLKGKFIIS